MRLATAFGMHVCNFAFAMDGQTKYFRSSEMTRAATHRTVRYKSSRSNAHVVCVVRPSCRHTRSTRTACSLENRIYILCVCRVESISSPVVGVVLRLSSSAPTSSFCKICHVIQRRSDCFVCFLLFIRSFVYRFQYRLVRGRIYTSFGYSWFVPVDGMAKRRRGQACETGVGHGTANDTAAHRKQFGEHQFVLHLFTIQSNSLLEHNNNLFTTRGVGCVEHVCNCGCILCGTLH